MWGRLGGLSNSLLSGSQALANTSISLVQAGAQRAGQLADHTTTQALIGAAQQLATAGANTVSAAASAVKNARDAITFARQIKENHHNPHVILARIPSLLKTNPWLPIDLVPNIEPQICFFTYVLRWYKAISGDHVKYHPDPFDLFFDSCITELSKLSDSSDDIKKKELFAFCIADAITNAQEIYHDHYFSKMIPVKTDQNETCNIPLFFYIVMYHPNRDYVENLCKWLSECIQETGKSTQDIMGSHYSSFKELFSKLIVINPSGNDSLTSIQKKYFPDPKKKRSRKNRTNHDNTFTYNSSSQSSDSLLSSDLHILSRSSSITSAATLSSSVTSEVSMWSDSSSSSNMRETTSDLSTPVPLFPCFFSFETGSNNNSPVLKVKEAPPIAEEKLEDNQDLFKKPENPNSLLISEPQASSSVPVTPEETLPIISISGSTDFTADTSSEKNNGKQVNNNTKNNENETNLEDNSEDAQAADLSETNQATSLDSMPHQEALATTSVIGNGNGNENKNNANPPVTESVGIVSLPVTEPLPEEKPNTEQTFSCNLFLKLIQIAGTAAIMTALLIWLTPLPLVNAAVIGVVTTVLLERGGLFGRRGEPQGKPPPIVNESSLYPKQALSS